MLDFINVAGALFQSPPTGLMQLAFRFSFPL
uniref:Uncharacterized protein LOC107429953 isoform X2 n=1 Tax=Rhizophora mucronata TaxID=61149 RepID=A0A2P2LDK8_RHIMU